MASGSVVARDVSDSLSHGIVRCYAWYHRICIGP